MSKLMEFGQVEVWGWGYYVPEGRMGVEEVGERQGRDGAGVGKSLGVRSKAVAEADEDTLTLSWEAGRRAFRQAQGKLVGGEKLEERIGAVYVGSESHPYAVKPTASMLGEVLGVGREYMAADLEFACKAGTAGVQMVASQVEAGLIEAGLAVGADVSQAKPGDVLEFTAGAGAGAVVLGRGGRSNKLQATNSKTQDTAYFGSPNTQDSKCESRIKLVASYSYTSDTPDFWRREGQRYPEHGGRFSGEPGYFGHVVEAGKRFMQLGGWRASDFGQVVLHMPNGKFPERAAEMLGFSKEQMRAGFGVGEIGNPYSGSSMVGMCKALEVLKTREKLLVISYGSGSGSDVLLMEKEG